MGSRARGGSSSEDEFDESPHPAAREADEGEASTDADAKLRAMFDEVDADGSGYIDREELVVLGAKLGKKLKRREVDAAMREMDPDGDDMVTFEEFSEWWAANRAKGGGLFGGLFSRLSPKFSPKFWKKRDKSGGAAKVEAAPAQDPKEPEAASEQDHVEQEATPTARVASNLSSSGSFRAGAARIASKLSSKDSFRGAVNRANALRSPSYRSDDGRDLIELGERLAAAVQETAALRQQCDQQEVNLGSLTTRLELVETRSGANAKAIAAARTEVQTWVQENDSSGVAAVQRRLEDAERQWAASAAANDQAVQESKAAIASMQVEVLETITGISGAIRKKRCVHCSCVFTDGANTSHSCVYHPGEQSPDGTWTCCNRRCGSGGRLVNGCLADFHRHMERATVRTPGLIPWATCPQTKKQRKQQQRQRHSDGPASAEVD